MDVNPTHMTQPPSKRIAQGSQNGSYNLRNTLPPGWLDCTPYGDALGFIIPSKVPLEESVNDKIVVGKRYSPRHAILRQRRLGRELGLVIDLTDTDRYYLESDWMNRECRIKYVKIRCAGKDSVPDNESVEKFIREETDLYLVAVDDGFVLYELGGLPNTGPLDFNWRTVFTKQAEPIFPKDPTSDMAKISKLIHGSQNGSFVTNSLAAVPLKEYFNDKIDIDKRYSPQQAILEQRHLGREALNRFSKARPPGIYKQDYVDHLCNVFGELLPRTFVYPQTPELRSSPHQDDDATSSLQDNGFQENQVTNVMGKGDIINVVGEDKMENVTLPSKMTNDDILGDTVPLNRMKSMRQFCNKALKPKSQTSRIDTLFGVLLTIFLYRIYANVLTDREDISSTKPAAQFRLHAAALCSDRYPGVRSVCSIGSWPKVRTVYGP
nr:mRNA-capping enzyme-like isoform X2 [Tanacetum cinerariifolium]